MTLHTLAILMAVDGHSMNLRIGHVPDARSALAAHTWANTRGNQASASTPTPAYADEIGHDKTECTNHECLRLLHLTLVFAIHRDYTTPTYYHHYHHLQFRNQ